MRDHGLDGSPLTADEAMRIAANVGKIWKQFRRRSLDAALRDALASVLLECRSLMVPSKDVKPVQAIAESRYDIRLVVPMLRDLASSGITGRTSCEAPLGPQAVSSVADINMSGSSPAPPPAPPPWVTSQLLEASLVPPQPSPPLPVLCGDTAFLAADNAILVALKSVDSLSTVFQQCADACTAPSFSSWILSAEPFVPSAACTTSFSDLVAVDYDDFTFQLTESDLEDAIPGFPLPAAVFGDSPRSVGTCSVESDVPCFFDHIDIQIVAAVSRSFHDCAQYLWNRTVYSDLDNASELESLHSPD